MSEANTEYAVEPLDSSRFFEAASLLGQAFRNDPVIAAILPRISPERRTGKLTVLFEEMLTANARRNEPIGIVADGAVRAAAIVHRPGTYPLSLRTQLGIVGRVVLKLGPRGLDRFVRWSIHMARHHPTTSYFYLETLGVDPTRQGQGLGSAMLRSIVATLDAAPGQCILETANERNVALYQRFGFEIVSEAEILGAQVRFMLRRPRA